MYKTKFLTRAGEKCTKFYQIPYNRVRRNYRKFLDGDMILYLFNFIIDLNVVIYFYCKVFTFEWKIMQIYYKLTIKLNGHIKQLMHVFVHVALTVLNQDDHHLK